ncbi:hypothetical protein [Peribacillus frigoritolerans]|uniref:hypothetical protein n=1 Tax=Peribacillus frigoritolerans TaxID=450367 RepID=UPI001070F835|nr:hypothetical protein [Peribacillus frigoritolerans]TFH62628.1 hypothetical protein E4J71_02160 [Peribacillus frigoritolerans]
MSEIKCLVCKGTDFRKGCYEVDVKVEIYNRNNDYFETTTDNDLDFRLYKDDKNSYTDDFAEVYKYACEKCGYIMSFTKEKNVKSHKEKQEEKKKGNSYDWRNFE